MAASASGRYDFAEFVQILSSRRLLVHPCRLARAAALGAALAVLSACFSYTPAPASGPRVGDRVRIRVSGSEAEKLDSIVGLRDRAVEGDVLEEADSCIALAVPLPLAPSSEGGALSRQAQQRIVIPRADVQQLQLRRLDKLRTSLLVGGTVVGVVAIAVAKGSTLLGNRGPSGSPNETRVPRGTLVLEWRLPVVAHIW